jgi:hypothetical protein
MVRRRPRRSNDPLSIIRAIKTQKAMYWTVACLRNLVPGIFSTLRDEHFAKAIGPRHGRR